MALLYFLSKFVHPVFTRVFFLISLLILIASNSYAIEKPGDELDSVFVRDSIGTQVPLDLTFQDSAGKTVQLADYFKTNRPVVIVPAYYRCPRLCGLVMGGVRRLINGLSLKLGQDYQIVTVSFDDSETPAMAAKKAEEFQTTLRAEAAPEAWRFLVGKSDQISKLMTALGFKYLKDQGEFAHSAAVYVLTPTGIVSQYFSGIDFDSEDFRLSIIEASQGVLGSALDHILLYCYRFDPTKGKYTIAVLNLARVVSIGTFLILAFLVIRLLHQEKRRNSEK
jgi:protein SCO1/2